MGWKDWPSWLKGGLIFLIFPLIGWYGATHCDEMGCIIFIPFMIGAEIFGEEFTSSVSLFTINIINFGFFFIVGSIIGFIFSLGRKPSPENMAKSGSNWKRIVGILLVIIGLIGVVSKLALAPYFLPSLLLPHWISVPLLIIGIIFILLNRRQS